MEGHEISWTRHALRHDVALTSKTIQFVASVAGRDAMVDF